MISGLKNLAYLSSGTRTYGRLPVLGTVRGRWEFEFILKGRARPTNVACPGVDLEKPRLYVSHPESSHGWTDDPDGYSEILVIQFLEAPDELREQTGPARPLVVGLQEAVARQFERRLKEIRGRSSEPSAPDSLETTRLLLDLSALALEKFVRTPSRRSGLPDKVTRAVHWFEENLAGSPSVDAAAEAVGVSAAHLRRLFAGAGKRSPQEELTRRRMDAARRCLRDGWSQKAVSEFLGFSEPSAFARAFRAACGLPPGAWLARQTKPRGAKRTSTAAKAG